MQVRTGRAVSAEDFTLECSSKQAMSWHDPLWSRARSLSFTCWRCNLYMENKGEFSEIFISNWKLEEAKENILKNSTTRAMEPSNVMVEPSMVKEVGTVFAKSAHLRKLFFLHLITSISGGKNPPSTLIKPTSKEQETKALSTLQ